MFEGGAGDEQNKPQNAEKHTAGSVSVVRVGHILRESEEKNNRKQQKKRSSSQKEKNPHRKSGLASTGASEMTNWKLATRQTES